MAGKPRIRRKIRNFAYKWHRKVGDRNLKLVFHWDSAYPFRSSAELDESYRELHLYFNEKRWREDLKSDTLMEIEALHEVLHGVFYPIMRRLQDLGVSGKELERWEVGLTTHFERAIWRTYRNREEVMPSVGGSVP